MWKAITIGELRQLTRDLPVDLFLKLPGENYCHVFSRATGLDYGRLLSYRQKGVAELHYRVEDEELVDRYRKDRRMDLLLQNSRVAPEQKAGILLNWTEQTVAEVFSTLPMTDEAAASSKGLVTNLVDMMTQQPQSLAALLRLVSHGKYLYYHSVAVSVFSGLLARVSGKYSDADSKLIAWGGFLHDIGMSRMDEEWTCDPLLEMDSVQMDRIESHCRLGMEALQEVPSIPKEVRFMVYQHHENPSGTGLPNRLKGSAIHQPAMIIAVVDAWSALISRHPHRPALTPAEAIQQISAPEMAEVFDEQAIEWLKAALFPGQRRPSA